MTTPSSNVGADASREWQGETCEKCGCNYLTVYRVPDDLWAKIAPRPDDLGEYPEHQGGGLLCLTCADAAARERGISLHFDGVLNWPLDLVDRMTALVDVYDWCSADPTDRGWSLLDDEIAAARDLIAKARPTPPAGDLS